jgi:hypothetical protein
VAPATRTFMITPSVRPGRLAGTVDDSNQTDEHPPA